MSLKSVKTLLSVSSLTQLLHWGVIKNGTSLRRSYADRLGWKGDTIAGPSSE